MPDQIRIRPAGAWHRREHIDGGQKTACGEDIFVYASRESGSDHLCDQCFTRSEIQTGKIERLKLELEEETADMYHDPDEEPTDPDIDKHKL